MGGVRGPRASGCEAPRLRTGRRHPRAETARTVAGHDAAEEVAVRGEVDRERGGTGRRLGEKRLPVDEAAPGGVTRSC